MIKVTVGLVTASALLTGAPALAATTTTQGNTQAHATTQAHSTTQAHATSQGKAATAKPRISMEVARAKALAQVHGGKVTSSTLEHEHGQLVYSFDLQRPGKPGLEEVQISALDGKVVARTHETAAMEKAEHEGKANTHKTK